MSAAISAPGDAVDDVESPFTHSSSPHFGVRVDGPAAGRRIPARAGDLALFRRAGVTVTERVDTLAPRPGTAVVSSVAVPVRR
jgi:hypothetical protein